MSMYNQLATTPETTAIVGNEILRSQIEPKLRPQDMGKFIAIAVDNGEYEIDTSDQAAMSRLLARLPNARIWLARAGQKAAFRMGIR